MYGLEKKNKPLFEFDLEKDLRGNPEKMDLFFKEIEGKIAKTKDAIRDGSPGALTDELAILLQGYNALIKVVRRFEKVKSDL